MNNKIVIEKDIYNEQGVLLLSKGHEINLSDKQIFKLKEIGIFDKILKNEKNNDDEEDLESESQNIGEESSESSDSKNLSEKILEPSKIKRIKISRENFIKSTNNISKRLDKKNPNIQNLFKESSSLLEDIVFNSKDKEWYVYLKMIISYVDWMYDHSINTALMSCMIGMEYGYKKEDLYDLTLGAILHDLGMVLIPKNVLNKKRPLNDFQLVIIRNHCEMGYSLLKEVDIPDISQKIILQHHERNNGTGYPNGLKSEEILTQSKIVMVSEHFDTATTLRSYKKLKSVNIALYEMYTFSEVYPRDIVNILKTIFY